MIMHEGTKWILYTRDGKKKLGEHKTKEEAMRQEQAILSQQREEREKAVDTLDALLLRARGAIDELLKRKKKRHTKPKGRGKKG